MEGFFKVSNGIIKEFGNLDVDKIKEYEIHHIGGELPQIKVVADLGHKNTIEYEGYLMDKHNIIICPTCGETLGCLNAESYSIKCPVCQKSNLEKGATE